MRFNSASAWGSEYYGLRLFGGQVLCYCPFIQTTRERVFGWIGWSLETLLVVYYYLCKAKSAFSGDFLFIFSFLLPVLWLR